MTIKTQITNAKAGIIKIFYSDGKTREQIHAKTHLEYKEKQLEQLQDEVLSLKEAIMEIDLINTENPKNFFEKLKFWKKF